MNIDVMLLTNKIEVQKWIDTQEVGKKWIENGKIK